MSVALDLSTRGPRVPHGISRTSYAERGMARSGPLWRAGLPVYDRTRALPLLGAGAATSAPPAALAFTGAPDVRYRTLPHIKIIASRGG